MVARIVLVALAVLVLSAPAPAQIRAEPSTARRATTLDALSVYPVFYHLQQVRVRAKLVTDQVGTALLSGTTRLLTVGDAALGQRDGDVEVTGTFIDVGRLTQDDQRVSQYSLGALSQKVLRREWPNQGELPVLAVSEVTPAEPFAAPSVRGLGLDPLRFDGQTVTIAGRFRGRNLFGDQPAAPGRSKYDFVLQLADASVWVVGRRPRGPGFDLNVEARVDTGRWLEVRGDVHTAKGLTWIEAIDIKTTKPLSETAPAETTTEAAVPMPPPQVIFTTPSSNDVDVSSDVRVRLQFSRDMTPESFKGNVTARYDPREAVAAGAPPLTTPTFSASYDQGRRVLELKFATPFERTRTVVIGLGNGITAFDKQPLAPFELRFTIGS
ncbi:MAG TPA: Ig-like domain-containing protein [Luteitalea sp.]|nr:Ig-like domain-containing protein [Luteitalea sp.]